MKTTLHYEYSAEKNQLLIQERGISFEDVVAALENDQLLEILIHPNPEKYPGQQIYLIEMKGYVYIVPFVQKDENTLFLKTIIPSRKLTKKYLLK